MEHFSVDAYKPQEIAKRIEEVSISKANNDSVKVFILALLAGAFIAFGAAFFTLVVHESGNIPFGLMKLIGGLVFSLGLILVVVAGAELFTGNNLIVMAAVDRKVSFSQLLKNWTIVFFGNWLGASFIAVLIYFSGHWLSNNGEVGTKAVEIAYAKVTMSFFSAFVLGVLCNILVCLAVWLCFAGRSVTDKVLAIIFPISAFVAMGFEHSVANMYFIPSGILALQYSEVVMALAPGRELEIMSSLNIQNFLLNNLLPVTLGNILGGSFFVGIIYYFLYLRDD